MVHINLSAKIQSFFQSCKQIVKKLPKYDTLWPKKAIFAGKNNQNYYIQ